MRLEHALPDAAFDAAITMGCGDECPFLTAERREDWGIPDPKELPLEEFRKIRDLIGEKVAARLQSLQGRFPVHAGVVGQDFPGRNIVHTPKMNSTAATAYSRWL